jgi:hypothetical protein
MKDTCRCNATSKLTPEQEYQLYLAVKTAWRVEDIYPFPGRATVSLWAVRSRWGEWQPGFNPFGLHSWQGTGYKPVIFRSMSDAFRRLNAAIALHPKHTQNLIRYWRGELGLSEFVRTLARDESDAEKLLAALHHPEVIKLWTQALIAGSEQRTRHSPRNVTT